MDVTKLYKFIGSGAMDVTKPHKLVGFGAQPLERQPMRRGLWLQDVQIVSPPVLHASGPRAGLPGPGLAAMLLRGRQNSGKTYRTDMADPPLCLEPGA